jgi:hypothetical protein
MTAFRGITSLQPAPLLNFVVRRRGRNVVHEGRMGKWHWSLLILYLTAAAGYGGWRGRDLWAGWGVWCFLLPPIAWAALVALGNWRRNPMGGTSIKIALLMGGVGVVGIGGSALGIAWGIAEATGRWSSEPAVRAIVGVGLGAAAAGMALLAAKSRTAAEPRETSGSESPGGSAEPDAAADGGRDAGS